MNRPIDEKKQFSFVSIAFFNKFYSDADAVLDENSIFGGVFYTIGKGFSAGPSFRMNNLGGFTKKASILYVHQGKRLTFAALPLAVIYNDRIDGEIFLQLQYNRPISENWGIFAQLQGDIYVYKFSKIKRSYQQFRIGPAYKSFQFGMGLNLDQYGSNDNAKINLLLFVRKMMD